MKIVIIGVGEVGFHVAKSLSQEDHDIYCYGYKLCKNVKELVKTLM